MLQSSLKLLVAALVAAGLSLVAPASQADDYDDAWESYDYYDVGYDDEYDDDWYYDYYDYDDEYYDEYYDYYDYSYYDYDADMFDWEEDGLFD